MDKKRCILCNKKAVVNLAYGPHVYCKKHFCEFFEKRVKRNVKKQKLGKFDKILVLLDNSTNSNVLEYLLKFFHNEKKIKKIKLKTKDPWNYERLIIKKAKMFIKKEKCDKIFYASDINFESCRILALLFSKNIPILDEKFILPLSTSPYKEILLYAKFKGIKKGKKWHYPKFEKFLERVAKRNPSIWFNILKAQGVLKKLAV